MLPDFDLDFRNGVLPHDHLLDTQMFYHWPGCSASQQCDFRDSVRVNGIPGPSVPVIGIAYVNELGGELANVTTIYGKDMDPLALDIWIEGFNPLQPELEFSEETFIGLSQVYVGTSLGTIAIGDLATNFPNFDLSPFSIAIANNPSAIVYAFETTVRLSDFASVPEPAAIILLGSALLLVGGHRSRRV